jgi:hypothetical protein
VVVYQCDTGHLKMGLFDMLRLAGNHLSTNDIFTRQEHLHDVFARALQVQLIQQHLVGWRAVY